MINNKYFIRRKAVNTLILKFHPIIKFQAYIDTGGLYIIWKPKNF